MKLVIDIDDKTYRTIKDGLFLIKGGRGSARIMEYNALRAIYDGKPLEQEPKTGHWITWKEADNEIPSETRFECSVCHDAAQTLCNGLDLLSPYCPNCGAKMIEPKESEVKECYNGGWIPVSERLPEQYEEFIVTDIETSDTYQSRYIDEFPNIDELVYKKIINEVPIIDEYANQEINKVLEEIKAEINYVGPHSDYGMQCVFAIAVAIIDKHKRKISKLNMEPTKYEFQLKEGGINERQTEDQKTQA